MTATDAQAMIAAHAKTAGSNLNAGWTAANVSASHAYPKDHAVAVIVTAAARTKARRLASMPAKLPITPAMTAPLGRKGSSMNPNSAHALRP